VSEFPNLMTRDLPPGLRLVRGGVTAAPGFRAGATACGIKSDAGVPDLAMLVADEPCLAVGTFTTSRTPAHPVLLDREHLAAGNRAQVVVVNSGNANCANGERGTRDAHRMAEAAAQKFGLEPTLALVSSTGIIGRPLPIEKVERGIAQIEISSDGGPAFARAILTTDTREKTVAVEFDLDGTTVRLGGSTKGAGMIYPNMATMLCYLTSDVAAEAAFLQQALRLAVADSFNMVCVDGDMSTNDTVLLLANGRASNAPLRGGDEASQRFTTALRFVTRYLAREMARDGEGATHWMEVTVRGAATDTDARKAARAITASPLWQCAVAGEDPNWGRIVAALGASGAQVESAHLDVHIGDVTLVRGGLAADYDQDAAKRAMGFNGQAPQEGQEPREVRITVDLHQGPFAATAWGCDLTHGYIVENTTYTR
jgi:glutamate N-acetyltransferase / amino-acid N-acetyltransferase